MKTNFSKMLIHEPPLQVLPSLAMAIGLNEALFLQQVHYWLQKSPHERDGQKWVYNTVVEWQKQFPFWSAKTIIRIVDRLKELGVLMTANYNAMPMDRTLWYSIDYDAIDRLPIMPSWDNAFGQSDQIIMSTCPDGNGQVDQGNNHRLPETTTEIPLPNGNGAIAQAHRKPVSPEKDTTTATKGKRGEVLKHPLTGETTHSLQQAFVAAVEKYEPGRALEFGRIGKGCKDLVRLGWTAAQITETVQSLKAGFYADKPVTIEAVRSHLPVVCGKPAGMKLEERQNGKRKAKIIDPYTGAVEEVEY